MHDDRTSQLWEAIEAALESEESGGSQGIFAIFPKQLLLALRASVLSGLTSDQITSVVLVMAGLEEMKGRLEEENLVDRIQSIVRSICEVES